MRSKAWLAARVSLRLARMPRTASSVQRSRRLRSMRAAAPVLLAHALHTSHMVNQSIPAQCACSPSRAVLTWSCYAYLSQSPLLSSIPPCIIMSSDPPPRRSSRFSYKRTVVPDDGTESVVMTVTKRRGKRTDAGRRHIMTCTFVIDVLRILYDTVSSRYNIWKNSAQCIRGVVCSAVMR